ncbi:site-specific DNA-methyltransferase [Hyphococcus formosus]|uniref:DNA-methyltransferase n=1 Tax=Hyphococcus formosus TaxID=3143534 RepID=UPI00398B3A1E
MSAGAQKALTFHSSSFEYRQFLTAGSELYPYFVSDLGALFKGDCLDVLLDIQDECVDTVFADPPFNLQKEYGENCKDKWSDEDYLEWCGRWIDECIRILKPGGTLFIYNLPKWNVMFGPHLLSGGMQFRHWIAIAMSNSLPIQGRLYPAHYSLLYYTKGKPRTFRKIRTPIERCRHCDGEIKDYGGHRKAMNPRGVNLKDIWTDIPPVRHRKFKSKDRKANALSTKLLERVVEMTTEPGDVVLDPFGGSGTTYSVCEAKHRHWLGVEIDFVDIIKDRLESDEIVHHKNDDYVEG